jgi:hypothetical protein
MKRYLFISLLFFSASFAFAAKKGPKTPEALGAALLEAFKKNDAAAFKKLFITEEEFYAVVNSSTLDEDEKRIARKKYTSEPPDAKALSNFEEEYQNGKEAGMNWKNAKLGEVTFESRNEKGVQMVKLSVNFTESVTGMKLAIVTKECFKTSHGWKLSRTVRLKIISGKEKPYEKLTYEQILMDSIRMADSMNAVMNAMYEQMMQDSLAMVEQMENYAPEPDYCTLKIDSVRKTLKLPGGQKIMKWMEPVDSTGYTFLITRKPIRVSDTRNTSELTVTLDLSCSINIYIRNLSGGKVWVDNGAKILVTYTDGTWTEMRNEGEMNCFGDVRLSFWDEVYKEAITKKKVRSIKIENKNGVLERILSPANSTELFEIMNCLPK